VNDECARTPGVAPINCRSGRANTTPHTAERDATKMPRKIAWTAAAPHRRLLLADRRATVAVAPTLSPAIAA